MRSMIIDKSKSIIVNEQIRPVKAFQTGNIPE